jgi:hypothetical protein
LAVSNDHCGSVYGLGDRFSQNHVSVESRLWWKAGWQLHWHRIVAYQPVILRLGSFSLPINDTLALETTGLSLPDKTSGNGSASSQMATAFNGERAIAIHPLHGFARVSSHMSDRRLHILTAKSLVLAAESDRLTGEHQLLALTWAGLAKPPSEPWTLRESSLGHLSLHYAHLGPWQIKHPDLPSIA